MCKLIRLSFILKFHDGPFPMWSYDNRRYDLGSQYIIESRDKRECMVRPLPTGKLPSVWTFLRCSILMIRS